ncbi:hypothetical protein [Rhizobium sp. BR 315]|uniref:hypothetical protein n=1 Tax=Rhizobium sp. BR 315 TaxID=3040014 RepID=UPI003D333B53
MTNDGAGNSGDSQKIFSKNILNLAGNHSSLRDKRRMHDLLSPAAHDFEKRRKLWMSL